MGKKVTEMDWEEGKPVTYTPPKEGKHRVGPIAIIKDIASIAKRKGH